MKEADVLIEIHEWQTEQARRQIKYEITIDKLEKILRKITDRRNESRH